jgi:hypothetical protein
VTRWVFALVLGAIGAFVIVGNPVTGVLAMRRGRGYSSVPLIGGMLGFAAMLVCPVETGWLTPLPLLLDYTIPLLAYLVLTGKLWTGSHQ